MIPCPCGIARADCTYHKPEEPEPSTLRIPSGGRGSGRTTRQLQALPKNAWFFCRDRYDMTHKKHTAKAVNRTDIIMKDVNELRDYSKFHGYWIRGFDIDHAVIEQGLDAEILDGANKLRSCVKPWAIP